MQNALLEANVVTKERIEIVNAWRDELSKIRLEKHLYPLGKKLTRIKKGNVYGKMKPEDTIRIVRELLSFSHRLVHACLSCLPREASRPDHPLFELRNKLLDCLAAFRNGDFKEAERLAKAI